MHLIAGANGSLCLDRCAVRRCRNSPPVETRAKRLNLGAAQCCDTVGDGRLLSATVMGTLAITVPPGASFCLCLYLRLATTFPRNALGRPAQKALALASRH